MNTVLSKALKAYRDQENLSQEVLAERVGVCQPTISRLENGSAVSAEGSPLQGIAESLEKEAENEPEEDPPTYTLAEVLQMGRNVGVDFRCPVCASMFFTGSAPPISHTCKA